MAVVKHMCTGQLIVFVTPQQILKRGQGYLRITYNYTIIIPLKTFSQEYFDLGQMIRISVIVLNLNLFS